MNILRDTAYWLDPKFMKMVRDNYSYESEFETPSTQRTWIYLYLLVAFACFFLSPLLPLLIENSPKKNIQWEFIFYGAAVALAGVGIFSLIQGARAIYKKRILDRLRKQNPAKPWKWRKDWSEGNINNKKGNSSAWIIAIIYNILIIPMAIGAIASFEYDSLLSTLGDLYFILLAVLPLLLAGVGLFIYAILQTLRRSKFGTSVCKPSILPIKRGV